MDHRSMASLLVVAPLLVTACIGDSSTPTPPGVDAAIEAATDAATTPDVADGAAEATIDAGPCNLAADFGTPVALKGDINTSQGEWTAALTDDELQIFFARTQGSNGDLYYASRTTTSQPFGASTPVATLNTGADERSMSLATDGRTLFFSSSVNGTYDLFRASRASSTAGDFAFGAPAPLSGLNTNAIEGNPALSRDGTELFFSRDNSILLSTGPTFSTAAPISVLTSHANAVPTADGLTLYVRDITKGSGDIYRVTRPKVGGSFGTPVPVSELNTADIEIPTWLSPDGCRLYFSSGKSGGAGGMDLYVAEKPKN